MSILFNIKHYHVNSVATSLRQVTVFFFLEARTCAKVNILTSQIPYVGVVQNQSQVIKSGRLYVEPRS